MNQQVGFLNSRNGFNSQDGANETQDVLKHIRLESRVPKCQAPVSTQARHLVPTFNLQMNKLEKIISEVSFQNNFI